MTRLTVFYDARCGLCSAVRAWLDQQPQLVPLECRPSTAGGDEVVVQADTGEVWRGDAAWLVVLWALARYRHWSYRLASPGLMPVARRLFAAISGYRGQISCSLGLTPEVR
jgi:hypothetical protein